jgi:hypothetical protein
MVNGCSSTLEVGRKAQASKDKDGTLVDDVPLAAQRFFVLLF